MTGVVVGGGGLWSFFLLRWLKANWTDKCTRIGSLSLNSQVDSATAAFYVSNNTTLSPEKQLGRVLGFFSRSCSWHILVLGAPLRYLN